MTFGGVSYAIDPVVWIVENVYSVQSHSSLGGVRYARHPSWVEGHRDLSPIHRSGDDSGRGVRWTCLRRW